MNAVGWWILALLLVVSYPKSAKFWSKNPLLQLLFAFSTLIPFIAGVLRLRLERYTLSLITAYFYYFMYLCLFGLLILVLILADEHLVNVNLRQKFHQVKLGRRCWWLNYSVSACFCIYSFLWRCFSW